MAINIAVSVCVALSLAGVICACNSNEQYRIIKFNSLGGSAIKDLVINLAENEEIFSEIPIKEGYKFCGWYFDKEEWSMPLSKNSAMFNLQSGICNVYAKWDLV